MRSRRVPRIHDEVRKRKIINGVGALFAMGKIKRFSVVLSGGNNIIYHPGSFVELSEPQNLKSISIVIFGKARVKFSKGFINNE